MCDNAIFFILEFDVIKIVGCDALCCQNLVILPYSKTLNFVLREFEPFAASPPAPEDSFFYIRYPKTDVLFGKPKVGDIPKLMNEQQKDQAVKAAYNTIKEQDWSKHTKPCQDVLHGIAPINKPGNITIYYIVNVFKRRTSVDLK